MCTGIHSLEDLVMNVFSIKLFYLIEGFVAGTLDSKVDHGVGEGATHVELQGQVVHPLHSGQLVPYRTVQIPF
jgi:hypothetical protein